MSPLPRPFPTTHPTPLRLPPCLLTLATGSPRPGNEVANVPPPQPVPTPSEPGHATARMCRRFRSLLPPPLPPSPPPPVPADGNDRMVALRDRIRRKEASRARRDLENRAEPPTQKERRLTEDPSPKRVRDPDEVTLDCKQGGCQPGTFDSMVSHSFVRGCYHMHTGGSPRAHDYTLTCSVTSGANIVNACTDSEAYHTPRLGVVKRRRLAKKTSPSLS